MTKKKYTFRVCNPRTGWTVEQHSDSISGGYQNWKKFWFTYCDTPDYLFGWVTDNTTGFTVARLEHGKFAKLKGVNHESRKID